MYVEKFIAIFDAYARRNENYDFDNDWGRD